MNIDDKIFKTVGIIGDKYDYKKNFEGYLDMTAYEAIRNINKDDEEFNRLLHTIFYLCDLAGYKIDGRIVLINKKSGKIYK